MDARLLIDDGAWLDLVITVSDPIFPMDSPHDAVKVLTDIATDDGGTDDILSVLCERVHTHTLEDILEECDRICIHLENVDPNGPESFALTTLFVACHASVPVCCRI